MDERPQAELLFQRNIKFLKTELKLLLPLEKYIFIVEKV